jgi:preprotein translocase subunit SecY
MKRGRLLAARVRNLELTPNLATGTRPLSEVGAMVPNLTRRIAFTVCAIVIYGLGLLIPIPGIDPLILEQFGAYSDIPGFATIFALRIGPYVPAAVLVQIASMVSKRFRNLHQLGSRGRRLLAGFTEILAALLAALQAFGPAVRFQNVLGIVTDGDWMQIPLTVAT